MEDTIRQSWLQEQYNEAMAFSRRSDVLSLAPVAGTPPYKYVARFECKGLIKTGKGIGIGDEHVVGIFFPQEYLRASCNPGQVLTWLGPQEEFHPNIRPPFCCVGHILPGMSLLSLLFQLYQMITWQRYTVDERDALNPEACRWARQNMQRLPIDTRRSMAARAADANPADKLSTQARRPPDQPGGTED